jgi:Tol biopolymer transport system component
LDETRSLVQVLVSPREDKLAGITRENQLVVVDLQGNQKVLKTDNHPVTQGSWSPDGKFLVYVGWPENWKYSTRLNARTLDELHAAMNSNLYILDIESGEITQLTHSIKENYNPIWSPDGKTILFISLRTNYASYFRIDADGTGETQLTNINHETHPIRIPVATSDKISWNPQGTVLVYETCMKPKENTIWTIQPDGINPTKLGLGTYPQWSENGQDVVYTTPDNNIQVWNTVSGKPAGMMKVTP